MNKLTLTIIGISFALCTATASADDRKTLLDQLTQEMAISAGKSDSSSNTTVASVEHHQSGEDSLVGEQSAGDAAAATIKAQVAKELGVKQKPSKKSAAIKDTFGTKTRDGSMGYLSVGIALLLFAGIGLWLKKRAQATGTLRNNPTIETLASTRVGGKHVVSLIRVAGRILVVGMGENGLNLLTEMDEAEMNGEVPLNRSETTGPDADNFLAKLVGMNNGDESDYSFRSAGRIETKDEENAPVDELLGTASEQSAIRERLQMLRQRASRSGLGSIGVA